MDAVTMLFVNVLLFGILVRILTHVLRKVISGTIFRGFPVTDNCKVHSWDRTVIEKTSGANTIRYCTSCGLVSEEGRPRYLSMQALDSLTGQRTLIAQYAEAKGTLKKAFLRRIDAMKAVGREEELENLILQVEALGRELEHKRHDLMRMNGRTRK
jgi:hypothetical protein